MEILNSILLALLTIAVGVLGLLFKSIKHNNPSSHTDLAVMGVKLDEAIKKLDIIIEKLDNILGR